MSDYDPSDAAELERYWRDEVLKRLDELIEGPNVEERVKHRAQWNRAFDERLKSIDGCLQVITICAVIVTVAVVYLIFFK